MSATTVSQRKRGVPRYGAEPSNTTRRVILIIVGVVFLIPLFAMAHFTVLIGQPVNGVQTFGIQHYLDAFNPANEATYDPLYTGLANSLVIALLTSLIVLVLLLPTMILVELKFQRFRRLLEFICLIPITIPTIVLVVGFIPAYQVVSQIFGTTPYTLAFAVGIIVLPYAYRPIAANLAGVDVIILSEAGRSLGAGWFDVIWRIILPNIRRGILSAIVITVAVVLGEYTIANFLSQDTFQTGLFAISQQDPYVAIIFALLALLFATILLIIIGRLGTVRGAVKSRRKSRTS